MRQKDDMNELDDTYYIRKILDGDMEFFSRLVDRYSHRVYLLILKIVRYKEEAEELTQDVFVKVFQVLHSFKGDCRFFHLALPDSLQYGYLSNPQKET